MLSLLVYPQSSGSEGKVVWSIREIIWESKMSRFPSVQISSMGSRIEIQNTEQGKVSIKWWKFLYIEISWNLVRSAFTNSINQGF